jgi:hypothetical protein
LHSGFQYDGKAAAILAGSPSSGPLPKLVSGIYIDESSSIP